MLHRHLGKIALTLAVFSAVLSVPRLFAPTPPPAECSDQEKVRLKAAIRTDMEREQRIWYFTNVCRKICPGVFVLKAEGPRSNWVCACAVDAGFPAEVPL